MRCASAPTATPELSVNVVSDVLLFGSSFLISYRIIVNMIINTIFLDDMSSVNAVIVQVPYVIKLTDECFVE